jgi:GNAT superfamily N-acetyltransferase
MRAKEFIVEYKKYPTQDYEGIKISMVEKDGRLFVRAIDDWGVNELGSVEFVIGDSKDLDPQDLQVDDRYQGQGIARTMYDYVKSQGYKIVRSWDQTDAGAGFWNKHRGEDVRVWEQGVAEASDHMLSEEQPEVRPHRVTDKELVQLLGKGKTNAMLRHPWFQRYSSYEKAYRYARDRWGFVTVDMFPYMPSVNKTADGSIRPTIYVSFIFSYTGPKVVQAHQFRRDQEPDEFEKRNPVTGGWKHGSTWKVDKTDEMTEDDDQPTQIRINSNARALAWIEKVYAAYPQTWQNNHVMPLGGSGDDQQFAMFELVPSMSQRGAVEIKWFQAYPLRQGVGTRAMQELQRLAQADGISLTLFPWDKGQVSQSKLMKFYKSAGFQPTVKGSKSLAWSPESVTEDSIQEDAVRAEAQAAYMQGQCMILAIAINQLNPKRYPIGYIWEYNAGIPDMQLDDDEWENLSPQEQEEISKDISRHSLVHAYVRDTETNEYIDARGRHRDIPNLWGRLGVTRFEEFPGTASELIDITVNGEWDEVGEQVNFKRGQPAFDSIAGPAGVKRAQDYAVKYLNIDPGPASQSTPKKPVWMNPGDTLPPSRPNGTWVILGPYKNVLYRFSASNEQRARTMKDQWCKENNIDPDSYNFCRLKYDGDVRLGQPIKKQGMAENFADGKGPGRPGDSQRHGIPKGATMAQLEKAAKAPGRKGQLARWQINMRNGRKK